MLGRREFIKGIAFIVAGAAARPEQIEAFERYYTVNAPATNLPLICMDEIWVCGTASRSWRVGIDLLIDGEPKFAPLALNAFGGIIRWVAAPDQKVIASTVRWDIVSYDYSMERDGFPLRGGISYVDQNMVRHQVPFESAQGVIGYDDRANGS